MPNPYQRGPNIPRDVITQLADLPYSGAGVKTLEDLKRSYGIGPSRIGDIFGAKRRNLANRRGQALSSASARLGTRVATPESIFTPIEGEFAGAFGELEAQEAGAEVGQENFLTQLLNSVRQGENQFQLGKQGLQLSALGQQFQQDYYEQNQPGWLDDLLSGIGVGAQGAGALGWKPFASGGSKTSGESSGGSDTIALLASLAQLAAMFA